MDQPRQTDAPSQPEPRKPANRLQDDWLTQEQAWVKDEETGSASGFGQTDGENGGNRG